MPYHFEWVVPRRVVLTRIEGEVQPEETTAITFKSRDMILEGQAPVHFIIDVAGLLNQPFSLSNLNQWTKNLPENIGGWWIIINPGKIAMFAISLVSKTLHIKVKTAESVEDAVYILNNVDQTLLVSQPQPEV